MSLIVKPSGYLYIEVPSTRLYSNYRNSRSGKNIHHLHLNHFLPNNLNSACEKLGMVPVAVVDEIGAKHPSMKALYIKQAVAERALNLFGKQLAIIEDSYESSKKLLSAVLSASEKKIVLWGAGQDLFYLMQRNMELFSSDRIILVDGNCNKQDKYFFGLKVINPEALNWNNIGHVLITPSNQMLQIDIKESLNKLSTCNVKHSFLFSQCNNEKQVDE